MPTALQKYRPQVNTTVLFERVLHLLEKVTDEKFWHSLLGDRITDLLKRYFGNDFVMITLLLYVSPMLKTHWSRLVTHLMDRLRPKRNYLTVEIHPNEDIYDTIDDYIKENLDFAENKSSGIAKYTTAHRAGGPEIGLFTHGNDTNEITFNGRKLFVTWRHPEEDVDLPESFKATHLEISMEAAPGETINTLKEILQEWSDSCHVPTVDNERKIVTINHYEWSGINGWQFKANFEPRGVTSVNLAPGVKERLLTDISRFLSQKSWFQKRGIPFRRGLLFYGPPGTGKSSIIQALAGHLQLNINTMKLAEVVTDDEFGRGISKMPVRSMLVIEDIDHCKVEKVTMSSMLNALDGLNSKDGAIVVMTCNDINKLEPAMLRPGRIDVKINLDYAVHAQMESMFWRFFDLAHEEMEEMKAAEVYNEASEQEFEHDKLEQAFDAKDLPLAHHAKPISPPLSPHLSDDDEEEVTLDRRACLELALTKLKVLIPQHTVTTAELQALFTSLVLEMGPDCEHHLLMQGLIDRVPAFLEQTKLDRKQAEEHRKLKEKEREEAEEKKRAKKSKKDDEEEEEEESSDDDLGFGLFD
ncbi:P-loop containing nucleoside triphosphate hydrolase protein [Hesseltinella vesiculosa]|uniref:P-loop containing nucleoside triphosphate hydrolase protein n=1 Tax=Hesseltinella vesiculosa TaxID=101127 RepID=A0A1X2GIP8_9FUNG|nr:P-loop containing nucleoside triphosphate hydrolase protein [Hesseltinella vesiculosa]